MSKRAKLSFELLLASALREIANLDKDRQKPKKLRIKSIALGKANREIWRLTLPNIVSNITVPIMGMADVAIAGHCGGDDGIGAVAVGTTIFNMIYWNCSFLRMGTSGITARSYGAQRLGECAMTLARALGIAITLGIVLLCLKGPLSTYGVEWVGCGGNVATMASAYVSARFAAVPAGVCMFAITGWFIGMQDSRTPMWIAIASNIVNIGASWTFAVSMGMGVEGIAYGTVCSQYFSLAIAGIIFYARHKGMLREVRLSAVLDRASILSLFKVNADIFLRTLCLVSVFTTFTAFSSDYGATALASNSLMMQLFTLFSYMIDGIAYSAESVVGKYTGSGNRDELRNSVLALLISGMGAAALFTCAYALQWENILLCFSPSPDVIEFTGEHVAWAVLIPAMSFWAFVADGIMVGADGSRAMRNTLAASAALYFIVYFACRGIMGIDALWLGFISFLAARSILLTPPVVNICKNVNGERE